MGLESRRVEWEQRVAAWKASGLTQKEYSAREGIGFSSLRYWSARVHRDGKQLTLVPVMVTGHGLQLSACCLDENFSSRWTRCRTASLVMPRNFAASRRDRCFPNPIGVNGLVVYRTLSML